MSTQSTISALDHLIKSVTVFKSSKAEVVRTFKLDLNAGQTKIVIKDLPSALDTQTVRVSGLGDARLFDVICTVGDDKDPSYAPESSVEVIRCLSAQKRVLEGKRHVREDEAELLVNYTKTLTGEHIKPPQMSQFLESFVEQGRKNLDAINDINEKIVEIERQIERESRKKIQKKGDSRGQVIVVLGTDENTSIDLKLTYIVSDVQWKSTYELHASTENGKPSPSVSLHYRARVTQSTGEDWSNTSLTLSTVTADTLGKRIPELTSIRIRTYLISQNNNFKKDGNSKGVHILPVGSRTKVSSNIFQGPIQQSFGTPASMAHRSAHGFTFPPSTLQPQPAQESAPEYVMDFENIAAPGPITEPMTVVTETPIAISYSVHGNSTIPSDGIEHQVSIAVLPFEAKISYVAIPRIEPLVYLQCQVKNTSDYRLLPGPVNVILDDSHASSTFIGDVNIGDNFDCTLGGDTATKVSYSRTSRSAKVEGGSFSEDKKTVTHNTQITIHNKHTFAIPDLIVCDIIPTCDDERAKVILRKPAGLADIKAGEVVTDKEQAGLKIMWSKQVDGKGGEKEGKFEWRWSIAAGAKVTLESEWEIRAPSDVFCTEGPA
ncbi:hypothetical protein BDZ94DRAFT_1269216 [Collybia nuda]|uniref:Protein F37C4.5 n=1 Tax=Collybia nuda TaxID=64659 RepID=A0A9P5XWT9_9AGAR|nr:hypothetical protein BDZ94DRAFT_1269216 [Collybia nuda]